jgi:hypothetical protein
MGFPSTGYAFSPLPSFRKQRSAIPSSLREIRVRWVCLRSSSLASWRTWKALLIILIKKSVQVATFVRDQNWHCFPIGNMQGIRGTAAGFSPGRAHVDVDVLGILDASLNEVMSSADRSPIILNRP